MAKDVHTPGPWTAFRIVHEDTNEPMTPEQIGEYVCNSVKKSAEISGTFDFLVVGAQKPDGPADVCHVGNGPTSPQNARLIAAAPAMYEALKTLQKFTSDRDGHPLTEQDVVMTFVEDGSTLLQVLEEARAALALVEV